MRKSLFEIMHSTNIAESSGSKSLAVATQRDFKRASIAILGATLGDAKASDLADSTAKLVSDKDFLDELEGKIGLPKKSETEDEFVARAKRSMLQLLKNKLN